MSIMFESHSIIIVANQAIGNSTATNLIVDSEDFTLPLNQFVNVTPCVNLLWKNGGIHFQTPAHIFAVYSECKIFHIGKEGLIEKQCYLNFEFTVDYGESRKVGGILGETDNQNFTASSLIETDFIEETMTSNVSPKNTFKQSDLCALDKGITRAQARLDHRITDITPNHNFAIA